MEGFFRIYREQFQDLRKNREVLQVWTFLCEQARFRQTTKDDIEILPGQVLLSGRDIAKECDLDVNRVQYILRSLEKKGLILRENVRNRYSLITILEPSQSQPKQTRKETRTPAKEERQAPPPQPQEAKQEEEKFRYGLFSNVLLSAEEKRLLHTRSNAADDYIDKLSAYKHRENKEYQDDFAVLCEWISKDNIDAKRNADKLAASMQRRQNEQAEKEKMSVIPPLNQHGLPDIVSYDLELADRMAREHVPVMRKRPKREKTPII